MGTKQRRKEASSKKKATEWQTENSAIPSNEEMTTVQNRSNSTHNPTYNMKSFEYVYVSKR